MKKLTSVLSLLVVAVMLPAQFGGFGGGRQAPGGGEVVREVELSTRVFTTAVGGRLQPANSVNHSASVGGVVREVRVTVGQRVAAGDVLYTIDRDDAAGVFAPVVVTARIAGTVATVTVRPDNEIRSGESGVSIITTSEYVMTATISDKDAFAVTVGSEVIGSSASGTTVRGTLVARSPEPDYQTGLFTLAFRFRGNDSTFPGQFVTIDLPVETVRGIFVSQNLIFRRYGRYYLWTVDEEERLRAREVDAGRAHGNDVLITSGLSPGERILLQRRGGEQEGAPLGGDDEG